MCLDDVGQWRSRDATLWGVDRVKVEKVTNAARPSGGTPKLAFVRSNRVHALSLDDARQCRARDATVWGLDRVKVENVTKCGATEWRDFKACFGALRQIACVVSGRCVAVAQ
jgi:hypothetical protein